MKVCRSLGLMAACIFCFAARLPAQPTPAVAQLRGPTAATSQIIRAAANMLAQKHLAARQLDDDISRKWLDRYLTSLDGNKLFFRKSDVDRFLQRQDELDDLAKRGDVSLAYEIMDVLSNRSAQRYRIVLQLLKEPHDFTIEWFNTDPSTSHYAASDAEYRDLLRRRVKYDLLGLKAQGLGDEAARARLARRYRDVLRGIARLDDDDVLELYVSGLGAAYDPHSNYMSPKTADNFETGLREQLDGIGAALQQRDGEVVVDRIVPGGPVAKDGRLRKSDVIVGVGQGETGAIEEVGDMTLMQLVGRIRGKAGTVVRLQVVHAGSPDKRIYNIVRGKVQVDEVHATVLEEGAKADGSPYRIGVITVPNLYVTSFRASDASKAAPDTLKSSTTDTRRILADPERGFKGAGVDLVVLDLRHNSGGALGEALALPGLFIDSGPVIQVKNREGATRHSDDPQPGTAWDGPLMVLTSRETASGAEIIAAVLQDYKRALVVGDSGTAGLGTIQNLFDLGKELAPKGPAQKLGILKMTYEQFYRVNGESTQQRGVLADVVLPSLSDLRQTESSLPDAIPFDQVDPINHATLAWMRPDFKSKLQSLSDSRQRGSEYFRKLPAEIAAQKARLNRKKFSLNESTAIDELKILAQQTPTTSSTFESSPYTLEVLKIAVDYLGLVAPK